MMITAEKWAQLRRQMAKLGINEVELEESFILGSGRGGQKLQKTSSCVQLYHTASEIMIKCAESRSREQNRYTARRRLCEKIETIQLGEKSKAKQAAEKIRRQKKKRSKRAKQKILDNKAHQSKLKASRKKPDASKE